MGDLLGHAVRFGAAGNVLAAGEGIETMLSLRCALPRHAHGGGAVGKPPLAALKLAAGLRRLYIARDNDAAGDTAVAVLTERAEAAGIEALALAPRLGDLNEDLQAFDLGAVRAFVRIPARPRGRGSLHAPADGWDGVIEAGAPVAAYNAFRKAMRSLSSFHDRAGRGWPTSHIATALAFSVRSISV